MAAAVEGQGLLVHIGHTLAVDENVAGVGAVDAAQDVEQRGLAGAGRPQQHAEFAFFHGQVDAFQHLDPVFTAAKGLFDLIQFKKHRDAPLLVSQLQLAYTNSIKRKPQCVNIFVSFRCILAAKCHYKRPCRKVGRADKAHIKSRNQA